MRIRDFTNDDVPDLVRVLNEAFVGSYQFWPYDEDRLRSWIQDSKLQIFVAEERERIVGSTAYSDGHWGEEIEWLIVCKGEPREPVESLLLKKIEACVKRNVVFTMVDEGNPKINEWIGRGYRHEGGMYHMVARLDGTKSLPSVSQEIVLRSLRSGEEEALVEAVNAGFGFERLKTGIIQRWKTESPPFTEEWIHVAEANGKIISVVASRLDMHYNKGFGGKRGYLGPATTLPECRGKNLASALTRRAMNMLYEKGLRSVALYTTEQNASSAALLRKLGFDMSHHWLFMRKDLPQKQASRAEKA